MVKDRQNIMGSDCLKGVLGKVIVDEKGIKDSYHCRRVCNLAAGYAIQHIRCLSQARINREGCVRKGIRRKMGGWQGLGRQLVGLGWQSIRIVGVPASVIFSLLQ